MKRTTFPKPTPEQIRRAQDRKQASAKRYQAKQREKARTNPKPREPRKRIRPVNPVRKARLFEQQFLSEEYVLFIHSAPCAVPGCERIDIACAHVEKTRANGGRWYEIAPLCGREAPGHHQEQEGRTDWFNEKYGIDLRDIAAMLACEHKAYLENGPPKRGDQWPVENSGSVLEST